MFKLEEKTFVKALLALKVKYSVIMDEFNKFFKKTISKRSIINMKFEKCTCGKRKGRPRKTSNSQDEACKRVVLRNQWKSWRQIIINLRRIGINISDNTLRRRMNEKGIKSYKALKKPWLDERIRRIRLYLAEELLNQPDNYYENFIFIDEASINLSGEDFSKVYVKRLKNQQLNPENVRRKTKFNLGRKVSIYFIASVSNSGLGKLVYYTGTMNRLIYKQFLSKHFLSISQFLGVPYPILIHDCASYHRSPIIINFLNSNNIPFYLTPTNSPVRIIYEK